MPYCNPANAATAVNIIRKRRLLVFDVETTGLIPSLKQGKCLEEMPFIIQLSFIVFNLLDYTIEKTYNAYIRIQDLDRITDKISQLTGITREKCETEGIPVVDALDAFYQEYMRADYVIAHNISFDKQMILFEVERNYIELEKRGANLILNLFNPLFCKIKGIENYCTMVSSINICNILIESKTVGRKPYKKFPKLTELYFTLFHSTPENLHNALVDTLVCLRCFLKIKMDHDIHENKYKFMLKMVMQKI
jgi:DNA polymerase III epsilon subunit-like protein